MKEKKQWCERKRDECRKVDNVGEDDNDIPNLPSKCLVKLLNTMSKYDSSIFH